MVVVRNLLEVLLAWSLTVSVMVGQVEAVVCQVVDNVVVVQVEVQFLVDVAMVDVDLPGIVLDMFASPFEIFL